MTRFYAEMRQYTRDVYLYSYSYKRENHPDGFSWNNFWCGLLIYFNTHGAGMEKNKEMRIVQWKLFNKNKI